MYKGVVPAPDAVFMKRLKSMDKKLDCLFFREHEHFVITYDRATGDKAPIFMVKNDFGGFRQPDERDIKTLWDADCSRAGLNMNHRLSKMAYASELYAREKRRKATEMIRERTVDDKRQLVNAFGKATNAGKYNSTFRRITPKPKGQSISPI